MLFEVQPVTVAELQRNNADLPHLASISTMMSATDNQRREVREQKYDELRVYGASFYEVGTQYLDEQPFDHSMGHSPAFPEKSVARQELLPPRSELDALVAALGTEQPFFYSRVDTGLAGTPIVPTPSSASPRSSNSFGAQMYSPAASASADKAPSRFLPAEVLAASETPALLATEDPIFRMSLHQEAVYRRHIIQQWDVDFQVVFEQWLDSWEMLVFRQTERVARYWLESDENHGRESVLALAHDDRVRIELRRVVLEVDRAEEAERADMVRQWRDGVAVIASEADANSLQMMAASPTRTSMQVAEADDFKVSGLRTSDVIPPRRPADDTNNASDSTPARPPASRHRHAHLYAYMGINIPQDGSPQKKSPSKSPPGHAASPSIDVRPVPSRIDSEPSDQNDTGAPAARTKVVATDNDVMAFSTPLAVFERVADCECEARLRLVHSWEAENGLMLRMIRRYHGICRVGHARMVIENQESFARSLIVSEYLYMMQRMCETIEKLHRRELSIKLQPREMQGFRYTEKQGWLEARKRETQRFTEEELNGIERDKRLREELVAWSESRLRAKLDLNRAETNGRLAIMKDESSQQAILHEFHENALSELAVIQVTYAEQIHIAATTVRWTETSYKEVYLREVQHRSSVEMDEKAAFKLLAAAETSCYLAARRLQAHTAEVEETMRTIDMLSGSPTQLADVRL